MEQDIYPKRREAVEFFMKKSLLLSPDFINTINESFDEEQFYSHFTQKINDKNFIFLNLDVIDALNNPSCSGMNWLDFERSRVFFEKEFNKKAYFGFVSSFKKEPELEVKKGQATNLPESSAYNVNVLFSYEDDLKKKEIQDFVGYFNSRYDALKRILKNRQELHDTISINKLYGKRDRSTISLIGYVIDKSLTKNGNYVLTLEDPTGTIKVLVNKNKPECFNIAKEIVLDEVVGVNGMCGDSIVFANLMLLPDVPLNKEMKRARDECYAIFLSDLHVGSSNFLPEHFDKFLKWINCDAGSEIQKRTAANVKYIFIMGDLVDGVGVYPNQDSELDIKDIYEQYNECAKLLAKIPSSIKIIICPGNHDATRISEPQPILANEFTEALQKLPNVTLVSNPSLVNIHSDNDFPGFDVLMYHGYSFDYFVANVDTIREQGGYDRADLIMKFLLQRRHLAPTHTATLYIPDPRKDPLVIEKVPDFFATGHIHKAAAANYRNITMICGSCWQSKTSFQEKVGHNPEPARVPIVNLQTRQVKMLRF